MGQTLTHGIYLPDEGERNCYSGLAGNWQILDSSVGTIAAHTSALAGKAPLVHTHGKADITDLFNSANTWSGSQTFTANSIFSNFITAKESAAISAGGYGKGIAFRDYQDNRLGYIQPYLTSGSEKRLLIGADSGDIASNSNIIPNANNSVNLGSSSYQWSNLYAKNYYYNGVAWGLDKPNVWSNINSYQREITINGDRNAYICPMWEGASSGIAFLNSDATKTFIFGQYTSDANNRKVTDGTKGRLLIRAGERNGETVVDFEPRAANAILGTSTNPFKTLNGINPGALSLPKIVAKTTADISSAIVGTDGETQYLDGIDNYYTAVLDGWISMCIGGFTQSNELWITVYDMHNETWGVSAESSTSARNTLFIIFPIRANQKMRIRMKCTSVTYARFYPCEGNV